MMKYYYSIVRIVLLLCAASHHLSCAEQRKEAIEQTEKGSSFFKKRKNFLTNSRSDSASEVFDQSLQSNLPLTPGQIIEARKLFNKTQAAMATHPFGPPKTVTASYAIDLSSGTSLTAIRLAKGYVSTLVFVDTTGQPWPIESYTIGDPETFNIQWDERKSNFLMVQSNALYGDGNISVSLKGLDVPITLQLLPGQQVVDCRADIRIPREGPYATQHAGRAFPEEVSFDLLGVLDGVPPLGSKALRVLGGDGKTQAWLHGDHFYLRTRLMVSSPAWISMVSSADGMHAYALPRISFVLGLHSGKKVRLQIEGL